MYAEFILMALCSDFVLKKRKSKLIYDLKKMLNSRSVCREICKGKRWRSSTVRNVKWSVIVIEEGYMRVGVAGKGLDPCGYILFD